MQVGIQQNNNYKQGIYRLKNPQKYVGDIYNVVYRSSWEKKLFRWLDNDENVIEWRSEEIAIPYLSPIDNIWHRYFPDVLVKIKKDDKIETYLIEVKPFKQTKEPKLKKRVTKTYINEIYLWGINNAKWKAAKKYCADRNWKFKLMTEKDGFE